MELIRKCWPKGLAGKLIRFVIIFVVCLGIVFWTISYVQVALLKDTVKVEEENRSELVETEFKDSMSEFSQDFLLEMITWAADKTDDEFWIIEHDITSLGAQVESVFRNPENYERIPVLPPSKENAGKCVLQILYPDRRGRKT